MPSNAPPPLLFFIEQVRANSDDFVAKVDKKEVGMEISSLLVCRGGQIMGSVVRGRYNDSDDECLKDGRLGALLPCHGGDGGGRMDGRGKLVCGSAGGEE